MKQLYLKLINDPRIKNSLWMLVEKGISLFGLIFIISAVAKYTGPSIYGEISLAASIFIVLKTIAQLGLDQIYFKYVSQQKPYHFLFVKYANQLISLIYILLSAVVIGVAYFYSSNTGFYFILATCLAYYFNSIDLFNAYYEGSLLSKINVFANVIGLLVSLVLRWGIVFFTLDYLYLILPIILMTLIPLLIKMSIYYKKHQSMIKISNGFNVKQKKYRAYFFAMGIPLTLAVLTATVNGQISNFLLGYLENTKSVGIFSVAFVLAGAWCIIPTTLIMSYMTSIYNINNQDYTNYISLSAKIFRNLAVLALLIILALYFLAPYIIDWLYGHQYQHSINIFRYLILFQFFWVLNFYFSRIIIKYNGYRFLAVKSIVFCVFNFLISFVMIKQYSIVGAAIALILTETFSLLSNLLYRPAKLGHVIFNIGVKNNE